MLDTSSPINGLMNEESDNGASVSKSKLVSAARGPETKGGLGWGDFDKLVTEADHYFIDEDDAKQFFSVFQLSPLSSRTTESQSPIFNKNIRSTEIDRATPKENDGNNKIFYKQRVRSSSVDEDSPRRLFALIDDRIEQEGQRRRSKSSDTPVADKIEPLEGHRQNSRTKLRVPRRRHRSTSRDDHAEKGGEDDHPSGSKSRSPRSDHSRHRRHRSSSREKVEEDLIMLSAAVMSGKVPASEMALIAAERQRQRLEKSRGSTKRSDGRRHRHRSSSPGSEHT